MKMMSNLTIQEVSDRLGLPKSTLRYWEKELKEHIKPNRTPGGQRRYEMDHIAFFERVRAMKDSGMTLGKIKNELASTYQQGELKEPTGDTSIDVLAQRIAELVRREVRLFFTDDGLN
jgi:DNA-binding transcriptional MerR regulator